MHKLFFIHSFLCKMGYHCISLAGLELSVHWPQAHKDTCDYASSVLELNACTTTLALTNSLNLFQMVVSYLSVLQCGLNMLMHSKWIGCARKNSDFWNKSIEGTVVSTILSWITYSLAQGNANYYVNTEEDQKVVSEMRNWSLLVTAI